MQRENQSSIPDKFSLALNTFLIGLFGGLFMIAFFIIIYYFNIIEFNVYTPWKKLFMLGDKMRWYDYLIATIGYSFISIIIAFIYYIFGKKRVHWDLGAFYGIVLGIISYIIMPIILYDNHLLIEFGLKTHISFFVGFILFGMFIGYSISYEYYLKLTSSQH